MLCLPFKNLSKMEKPTIEKRNHKNINAKDNCLSMFKMQITAFK